MTVGPTKITAAKLSIGILVPTLTPFDQSGAILLNATTDQANRLARIEGVIGIAVNTNVRERHTLAGEERIEVIKRTRAGLSMDQLLLPCVGELSDAVIEHVADCQEAGANAVISFPAKSQKRYKDTTLKMRLDALVDLADQLPLPVIIALGTGVLRRPGISNEIATLARHSQQVIGFDLGEGDDVLHYDQDYYALKAMDHSVACLSSSGGALFHNLSTGSDGILSCLAYVAPHEVAALYLASRNDQTHEAKSLHTRLAPLIALLSDHDQCTREMIYREAAHYRGLLSSPHARGINTELCANIKHQLHKVIDKVGLKPIKWV